MNHPSGKTQPASPPGRLEEAIHLARTGQKARARRILRRVVAWQPANQAAWLWLSALAADRAEAEAALAQARRINPAHPAVARAEQWLARRFSNRPPTKASSRVAPLPRLSGFLNRVGLVVALLGVGIGLVVLLVAVGRQMTVVAQTGRSPTPDYSQTYTAELEVAWQEKNWPRAIAILEALRQARPNSVSIPARLSYAYLQEGLNLRRKGYIEEAQTLFEQSLALKPGRPQAQRELQLALDYLQGTRHYQAGRWPEAIAALEAVQAVDPHYLHLKDLLYSAYYNHGLALAAADRLPQAKTAFEAAIDLRPDLPDPRQQLAAVNMALNPVTPTAEPDPQPPARQDQLIVVGIAEQRMAVFEGDEQVFDFVVSTGEPGRDTAIGEFEILDKIDVAYASTWNLDMPYWMGIYWSGPLENGIHALPIVKHTGYKLWDGYLGQRVSYGCIILSDEDAATLYNWAEIGAKVKIVPSLSGWLKETP